RLAREAELRTRPERARDLEAPLVAVGELLRDQLLAPAQVAEGEELARLPLRLGLFPVDRRARKARDRAHDPAFQTRVHPDEDVLERGHVLEEADVLEGAAHAALGDRVRRLARDVLAGEDDLAPGRL